MIHGNKNSHNHVTSTYYSGFIVPQMKHKKNNILLLRIGIMWWTVNDRGKGRNRSIMKNGVLYN